MAKFKIDREFLISVMRARGMSQNAFSDAIGFDRGAVSLILRGGQSPSDEFRRKAAAALGLTIAEVLRRTGFPELNNTSSDYSFLKGRISRMNELVQDLSRFC